MMKLGRWLVSIILPVLAAVIVVGIVMGITWLIMQTEAATVSRVVITNSLLAIIGSL